MMTSGTLELAGHAETRQVGLPIGSLVEVTYTQPDKLRSYTYLGTVAMRPEDKAEMSVVTNKFGGEHIIPFAETYTIKTQAKFRNDYLPAEEDLPQQCVATEVPPVDLIFDPTHDDFDIKPVLQTVPSPR